MLTSMTRTKPKLFFIYLTARNTLLKDYYAGKEPSTFLYGLPELRKLGYSADFSDLAYTKLNFLNYCFQPLERLHSYLLNYPVGFRIFQALLLLPAYQKSDVIISTQDSAGLPFLMLKRTGVIKNKLIYVSSNLTNALVKPKSTHVFDLLRKNLLCADAVVCSSRREQELLGNFLHKQVYFLPDGVDINYFQPTASTRMTFDILSIGRDLYRDFDTLIKSVAKTSWQTKIVCSPEIAKSLKRIPKSVQILVNISSHELRRLYQETRLVVLPMKKTDKPQGHTVLLNSMSMEKPIIASDVPGITSAYDLTKYRGIQLVPPQDISSLNQAISRMLADPPQIKLSPKFRDSISTDDYAQRLSELIRQLP